MINAWGVYGLVSADPDTEVCWGPFNKRDHAVAHIAYLNEIGVANSFDELEIFPLNDPASATPPIAHDRPPLHTIS